MNQTIIKAVGLMALLLLIDQGIKIWVRIEIPLRKSISLIPQLIDLTHVENRGISFSMFGQLGDTVRVPLLVGISLIAIVILCAYWWRNRDEFTYFTNLAFVLILPGAFGNLVDRAWYGTVTDYLHFRFYATSFFVNNFADILISAGVVAYLIGMIKAQPAKN